MVGLVSLHRLSGESGGYFHIIRDLDRISPNVLMSGRTLGIIQGLDFILIKTVELLRLYWMIACSIVKHDNACAVSRVLLLFLTDVARCLVVLARELVAFARFVCTTGLFASYVVVAEQADILARMRSVHK